MRGGGGGFFPTLCCALFLWAATWTTPVAAEDNPLPVAADGNVVFLPWRCGGYVALPESEHTRRSLEAAGKFGGNGLRLRGGTIFFSAFRRGPGSLQIIIGRRGGDAGDDVNDIFTSPGVRAMSPLAMGSSRESGAGFPTSDDDSSRTLRAMGEEKQQGVQPDLAATTEGPNPISPVYAGYGAESSSDSSSSSSSSTFLDHLLSVLLTPPSHGLMMRQSPFLSDPAKLLLARTHGIRTIEDGTTSWLSRSRSGSVGEEEDEDGSISEREVVSTAAAAAAEAAKAARGDSSKGWELPRQLEVGDSSSSRGGVSDDASSRLLEGGFVGNNYLDVLAPKLVHVPGVYSWRARDVGREEEGTGDADGMFLRDVLLFPRRGEKQEWEDEVEEGWEGEGVVGSILRCVKGWWTQVSTWAAGVGSSMLETILEYQGSVEDCAIFALATAVPMTLLLLIVHVVAKCTYNEEEEEGEEEEEDDDDDDEEGGRRQGSRTVVVVTANSVGNDDVRTPLLDNRLYRGEDPTVNADDAMMSKLEATVVDYNPPNPADMTRGV